MRLLLTSSKHVLSTITHPISRLLRYQSTATASQQHNDLSSFLRYARLKALDPSSTVFNGTLYEYTVLSALNRCLPGILLERTGGKGDYGIDLSGVWILPGFTSSHSSSTSSSITGAAAAATDTPVASSATSSLGDGSDVEQPEYGVDTSSPIATVAPPTTIPLIIQCKLHNDKSFKGPHYVRELEGALVNHTTSASTATSLNVTGAPALGILASVRDMTPGMRKQMLASRRALGFIKVTPLEFTLEEYESEPLPLPSSSASSTTIVDKTENSDNEEEEENDILGKQKERYITVHMKFTGKGGLLQQFVWNEPANRYLAGYGIGARYVARHTGGSSTTIAAVGVSTDGMDRIQSDEGKEEEEECNDRGRNLVVESEEEDVNGDSMPELEQEITLMWNGVPVSSLGRASSAGA